jgi:hypothetical protein
MKNAVIATAHRVACAFIPPSRTLPSVVGALPPWQDEEYLAISEFARIAFQEISYRRFVAGISCPHSEQRFREFTTYVLFNMSTTVSRSLSLADTVLGALCIYSLRIARNRLISESDMRTSFAVALSLSNKISEDVPYMSNDWVRWSNLSAADLLAAEISWLQDLNWMVVSFTQGQNYHAWANAAAIWRRVHMPCFFPLYSSTRWRVSCTCTLSNYCQGCLHRF